MTTNESTVESMAVVHIEFATNIYFDEKNDKLKREYEGAIVKLQVDHTHPWFKMRFPKGKSHRKYYHIKCLDMRIAKRDVSVGYMPDSNVNWQITLHFTPYRNECWDFYSRLCTYAGKLNTACIEAYADTYAEDEIL